MMELKPGRELDALVAEKVMGFAVPKEGWFKNLPHTVAEQRGDDDLCRADFLPHFSTDIAAAWKVVEKLNKKKLTLELYSPGALINDEFDVYSEQWSASFIKWEQPCYFPESVGNTDTAPHAICLAALKAVDNKND